MGSNMIAFHISLKDNRRSIQKDGIEPAYSTGKRQVSWWCDNARVMWALTHLSLKYNVPVADLIICVSVVPYEKFQRTRWQGVYTTYENIRASQFQSPKKYMDNLERNWALQSKVG